MAHMTGSRIAIGLLVALGGMLASAQAQRAAVGTGGSLPLSDVMVAATRYPNLIQQIRLQLLAAGLKREQVICTAGRFSNQWVHLGGGRIGPYDCRIGKRVLRVTTIATYYDRNGHRLKDSDPALSSKAVRVSEGGFRWTWM